MSADAWSVADPCGCPICGREACEDHLPPDPTPSRSERPRLRAIPALELLTAPRPVEIIEGIAWANCLTVLVSESGAGKTFVLLDAAAAVSDGVPWHGRGIQQGSVAYLSYEGDALGTRLRALRERAGRRLEHLYVIRAHDPLSPHMTREGEQGSVGERTISAALEALRVELVAAQRPPLTVLIVDTVRASMAGSEDSSEHVSAYLRAVRRLIAAVPGAAAVLAHHSGWQDGESQRKRERGSSAWRGNCDVTLYLEAGEYDADRGEAELTLRALKVRDAEQPAPLHLVRRRVALLESDRHGDAVTSCIVEHEQRSREVREADANAELERQQREADLVTLRAIAEHPDAATSQDRLRLLLGARKQAVVETLARLVSRGWVQLPSRQRQPYTVTEAGARALEAGL